MPPGYLRNDLLDKNKLPASMKLAGSLFGEKDTENQADLKSAV
jgi:hypothetical protein